MSNKSAYKKFMSKKVEVPIDDEFKISLIRPQDASATIDLRKFMRDLEKEDPDALDNTRMLKVTTRALLHCMPPGEEWTDDELMNLIVASGGEIGPLGMKVMALCGMPTEQLQRAVDSIGEDPTLSPGDTE